MPKPTLFQALLNQPSQSYAIQRKKKNYHSTKPQLAQIAAEEDLQSPPLSDTASDDASSRRQRRKSLGQSPARDLDLQEPLPPTLSSSTGELESKYPKFESSAASSVDGDHDGFLSVTTFSSRSSSRASSIRASPVFDALPPPPKRVSSPLRNSPTVPFAIPSPPLPATPDSDMSAEDLYYTPLTTPRESLVGQMDSTDSLDTSTEQFARALALSLPLAPPALIRHLSDESQLSNAATVSDSPPDLLTPRSDSLAGDSLFSLSLTASTRPTTPAASSVDLYVKSKTPKRTSSITASSVLSVSAVSDTQSQSSKGRSTSPGRQSRSTETKNKKGSYTDEDWAKDVRWLVKTPNSLAPSNSSIRKDDSAKPARRHRTRSLTSSETSSSVPSAPASVTSSTPSVSITSMNPPAVHPRPPKRSRSKPSSRRTRTELSSLAELPEPDAAPRVARSRSITASSSQYTSGGRTVALPERSAIQDLPSIGTRGFTSLVLPRAEFFAPEPTLLQTTKPKLLASTDITKTGLAQTTMATVEVVKGIASLDDTKWKILPFGKKSRKKMTDSSKSGTPLAFTSWRNPPKKVPGRGVLVQIWAIAVDEMDAALVYPPSLPDGTKGDPMPQPSVGFIPGRSFTGRVIECGWEVKDEHIKRGEWVIGIMDVRKSGAMAEFAIIDSSRIQRSPRPCLPSSSPVPNAITLEELALLPLCGLPALRAVGMLTEITNSIMSPRALVLRGHVGVGAMVTQYLAKAGWQVSVHVPMPECSNDGEVKVSRSYSSTTFSHTDNADTEEEFVNDIEPRVRGWGAHEVLFVRAANTADVEASAVALMQDLAAEGSAFDAIIDTLGGRRIWTTASEVLAADGGKGRFVTLRGDVPARVIPTTKDHYRAEMRSSGMANTKTDKVPSPPQSTTPERSTSSLGRRSMNRSRHSLDTIKTTGTSISDRLLVRTGRVSYSWASVDVEVDWHGRDIKESLGAVIRMALHNNPVDRVRPNIDSVVPFERAPSLFEGKQLDNGRTAVVKVVG